MDANHIFNLAFRDDGDGIVSAVLGGFDPNIAHPRGGHTPLQIAAQQGAVNAIDALIRMGADPNRRFDWTSRVDGRVYRNRTALMYASTQAAVRALVSAGADVNAIDDQGWSALARAVDLVVLDVFEELLALGADPLIDSRVSIVQLIVQRRGTLEARLKSQKSEELLKAASNVSRMEHVLLSRENSEGN